DDLVVDPGRVELALDAPAWVPRDLDPEVRAAVQLNRHRGNLRLYRDPCRNGLEQAGRLGPEADLAAEVERARGEDARAGVRFVVGHLGRQAGLAERVGYLREHGRPGRRRGRARVDLDPVAAERRALRKAGAVERPAPRAVGGDDERRLVGAAVGAAVLDAAERGLGPAEIAPEVDQVQHLA